MARRGRGRGGNSSKPSRPTRGRGRGRSSSPSKPSRGRGRGRGRSSSRSTSRGSGRGYARARGQSLRELRRQREQEAQANQLRDEKAARARRQQERDDLKAKKERERRAKVERERKAKEAEEARRATDLLYINLKEYRDTVKQAKELLDGKADVQVEKASKPDPETADDEEREDIFEDDNSIIRLGEEIHEDMDYSPIYTDVIEDTDYVSVTALAGDTEIGYLTIPITDPIFEYNKSLFKVNTVSLVRDKFGLGNGQYTFNINAYRSYVNEEKDSPSDEPEVAYIEIDEISTSRNEIRIKSALPRNYDSFIDFGLKATRFDKNTPYKNLWPVILKDIEEQIDIMAINWTTVDVESAKEDQIILKLVEPLSREIKVGRRFLLTRDIITPFQIPVTVDFERIITEEFSELRGPNYNVIDAKDKPAKPSEFESWNSILGTNATSKQSIIDTYVSSSDNVELNIDYRKYDTFVHFSSATERLKNFKYKLELIEYYNSQSNVVSIDQVGKSGTAATSSAQFLQNKAMYETKRANVISGFDGYEKYLYFESHSTEVTSYGTFPSATWPKTTNSRPYTLRHTTSSQAQAWYASQIESASVYDTSNSNILRNTIPQHILQDPNSNNYTLFVDMIGQHFDTTFNYIDQMSNVMDREESVYEGLSKDLIYDAAKSFGWTLQPGFDSNKLWEYLAGTDESGDYNSGNTYVVEQSYSKQDIEKQTWKRILNNIPYLLKTKGTGRGVKALLNTYGIPSTILRIQEYGGPAPTRPLSTRREIEKFSYALDFSGSSHIEIPHLQIDASNSNFNFTTKTDRYPSMYEFRFDTAVTESMHLVSSKQLSSLGNSRIEVILEHSSSATYDSDYRKYGRLLFKLTSGSANNGFTTMSTDYAPFYDNDWWNVSFGTEEYIADKTATTRPTFTIRYAKIGEHADDITHSGKTSFTPADVTETKTAFNHAWAANLHLLWGGSGSGASSITYTPFSGSMQEIRGWVEHISDTAFHQHALSPISIAGDSIESAYNDLFMRLPLGTDGKKYNHTSTIYIPSSVPNTAYYKPYSAPYTTVNTSGNTRSWPDSNTSYSNKSETYYVDVPNTVGSTANDSKIRIEDNSLRVKQLSWDKKFEVSPQDSNPLDSDEVSIAFSPQDQIDTDIAMQFGAFSLDDYIGDPRDKFSNKYSTLENIKKLYFKKYGDRYNIWAFIRMLKYINAGFWKQIESLLPARADAMVGIIIRPNILERHKVKDVGEVSQENHSYNTQLVLPKVGNISANINGQIIGTSAFGTYAGSINTIKSMTPSTSSFNVSAIGYNNVYKSSPLGSNSPNNYSLGYSRLTRVGSKISSTDFNEPSSDTFDGRPVVEFILTNPNRLLVGDEMELNQPPYRGITENPQPGRGLNPGDLTVE